RAPDALAGAGPDRQAVRVVDLRAPVVGRRTVAGAVPVHAGQRREAEQADRLAEVQLVLDVLHQAGGRALVADAERAGEAGAVQQRVDHQPLGRLLEPERGEAGELLASRADRVDGDAAGREAVLVERVGRA